MLHRPGRELLLPGQLGGRRDAAGLASSTRRSASTSRRRARRSSGRSRARRGRAPARATEREVLDALWDLVWAGEVTNDTFAPLRALRWKRPARSRRRRARPGLGRLTSLGPPEAAGRWSLVGSGLWDGRRRTPPSPTERLHQLALALLDRHGVLVRESVMAEGLEGGFSAVYPMLRALEEAGRIRRGYFVAGLGAAQFALAGALERLRAVREPDGGDRRCARGPPPRRRRSREPVRRRRPVAAPRRDRPAAASSAPPAPRSSSSTAIAALYLDRGGSSLQTLPAFDDPAVAAAALGGAARPAGRRAAAASWSSAASTASRWARSPWYETLCEAGFIQGYRGLVLRRERVGAMIA